MSLVLSIDNRLAVGGELTGTGWSLPADLTPADWRKAGELLTRVEQSKQWWLGDWWNAGVAWGEGEKVCEELGIDYGTVRNCGQVSTQFEMSRRRDNLSFKHHAEVCAIDDPAVQDRMLAWCEEPLEGGGKPRSTRELREQVRAYLDEIGWTDEERERREQVRAGLAVVVNQKTDDRLIRWAQFEGVLAKVDRTSDWGNPYEMPKDGDRDEVCDSFAVYFARKHSLLKRLSELRGKVLACWCHPERCHAHHIAALVNANAGG